MKKKTIAFLLVLVLPVLAAFSVKTADTPLEFYLLGSVRAKASLSVSMFDVPVDEALAVDDALLPPLHPQQNGGLGKEENVARIAACEGAVGQGEGLVVLFFGRISVDESGEKIGEQRIVPEALLKSGRVGAVVVLPAVGLGNKLQEEVGVCRIPSGKWLIMQGLLGIVHLVAAVGGPIGSLGHARVAL